MVKPNCFETIAMRGSAKVEILVVSEDLDPGGFDPARSDGDGQG